MVDGNGLENRRGETHRGFESLPLRQVAQVKTPKYSFGVFMFERLCGIKVQMQATLVLRLHPGCLERILVQHCQGFAFFL